MRILEFARVSKMTALLEIAWFAELLLLAIVLLIALRGLDLARALSLTAIFLALSALACDLFLGWIAFYDGDYYLVGAIEKLAAIGAFAVPPLGICFLTWKAGARMMKKGTRKT